MTADADHRTHPSGRPTIARVLRELSHQMPLAISVAAVLAVITGVLSARTPPVHRAAITAVVVPGSAGDTSKTADLARLTAAYVAAAHTPAVLAAATKGTGWDTEQAASSISVHPGSTPGVVEVLVSVPGAQGSSDQATQVASAVPTALQSQVLTEHDSAVAVWTDDLKKQLASVRAQYSAAEPGSANQARADADVVVRLAQLSTIQRAQPPALMAPSTAISLPDLHHQPLLDAVAAFALITVVTAALAMLISGRRGATVTRTSGRRLAARGRGTYLELSSSAAVGDPALLPLRGDIARALEAGREVVVLVATGTDLNEATALLVPASVDTTHLVVAGLHHPWWRYVNATDVAHVVLVANYGSAPRQRATDAIRAATGMGAPAHLLLLTGATYRSPTRARTLPARAPDAPQAPTAPSDPSPQPGQAPSSDPTRALNQQPSQT